LPKYSATRRATERGYNTASGRLFVLDNKKPAKPAAMRVTEDF
jgi:hypothetical protein